MDCGRWFKALMGSLLKGRARWFARRQDQIGPSSPEAHRREIQRLEAERERLRAALREQQAALQARHTILDQFPPEGAIPLAEVNRRLENLARIRQERLKAQEEACERRIRELEQQLRKGFGAP